jgi:hypothetical protein
MSTRNDTTNIALNSATNAQGATGGNIQPINSTGSTISINNSTTDQGALSVAGLIAQSALGGEQNAVDRLFQSQANTLELAKSITNTFSNLQQSALNTETSLTQEVMHSIQSGGTSDYIKYAIIGGFVLAAIYLFKGIKL